MEHMKVLIAALALSVVTAGMPDAPPEGPPAWAFPVNPPGLQPSKDDGNMHTQQGSAAKFSFSQVRDFFNPPDWYSDEHHQCPPSSLSDWGLISMCQQFRCGLSG
jgi:hypothetical protein